MRLTRRDLLDILVGVSVAAALTALIVSLLAPVLSSAAEPPAAPAPCVRVERRGAGVLSSGSGTVVACEGGRSLILTCRHVAGDDFAAALTVVTGDGPLPAKLAGYDRFAGLAVLVVDAELPAAAIADAAPADGTKVMQYGCTRGGRRTPKAGVVLAYDGATAGGTPVFGTTALADSGDSGCGVFAGDELVGVVAWKLSPDPLGRQPGQARGVHLCDVRRALGDAAAQLKTFPKLKQELSRKVVRPPTAAATVPAPPPYLPTGGT